MMKGSNTDQTTALFVFGPRISAVQLGNESVIRRENPHYLPPPPHHPRKLEIHIPNFRLNLSKEGLKLLDNQEMGRFAK